MPERPMSNREGSRHAPLRDVLAGLYNLETLLRSPRAANAIILGVLPELDRGARTLLAAYGDLGDDLASIALSAYAKARVDAICAAIAEVPPALQPRARLTLLSKVIAVRPDLVLAVDLLHILELSRAPEPTDLDLGEACRVAFAPEPKLLPPPLAIVHVEKASGSIMYDARILTFLLRSASEACRRTAAQSVNATEGPEGHALFSFTGSGALLPAKPEEHADAKTPSESIFRAVLSRFHGEIERGPPCRLRLPPMQLPRLP